MFNKTYGPTINFEAIDIHHHSCPSPYKLPDDPSKTVGLRITIHIKQNMVVELYAGNYATYDGLVNGVDSVFKTSSYHDKTIIWILFSNKKTWIIIHYSFSHSNKRMIILLQIGQLLFLDWKTFIIHMLLYKLLIQILYDNITKI